MCLMFNIPSWGGKKSKDDNSNSDDVGSSGDGEDIQDEEDNDDESLSIEEIESSGDNLGKNKNFACR